MIGGEGKQRTESTPPDVYGRDRRELVGVTGFEPPNPSGRHPLTFPMVRNRQAGQVENAFIESFNGKLRDECLNSHVFVSVAEAQVILDAFLAERFNPSDNATHNAADYSADGVPTARVQSTESATGHTQQNVTHGMA